MLEIYDTLNHNTLYSSETLENFPENIKIYMNRDNLFGYDFSEDICYENVSKIFDNNKIHIESSIIQEVYNQKSEKLRLDDVCEIYYGDKTNLNIFNCPYSIIFDFNDNKYKITIYELRFENLKNIISENRIINNDLYTLYEKNSQIKFFEFLLLLLSKQYSYKKVFFERLVFSDRYPTSYISEMTENLKLSYSEKNDFNNLVIEILNIIKVRTDHRTGFSIELLNDIKNEDKFMYIENPQIKLL